MKNDYEDCLLAIEGGGRPFVESIMDAAKAWHNADNSGNGRYKNKDFRCMFVNGHTYHGQGFFRVTVKTGYSKRTRILSATLWAGEDKPSFRVYNYSGTIHKQLECLIEEILEEAVQKRNRLQSRIAELSKR